jgi:uncharacterized protein YycO
MKHPLFPLLLTAFLCISSAAFAAGSCQEHLASAHNARRGAVEESLKKELREFRTLAERALALRAETIKVGTAIKDKIDRGRPLTGEDIFLINTGINEHLSLRDELVAVAESHECWLDGSEMEWEGKGITPESRLTGVMLSLSSAMLLYDNYLLAISLFEGDSKLRRILNERDPGYKVRSAALAKITMNYDSVSNRARVRRAIRFYERETSHAAAPTAHDRESEYLRLLIEQSPSYSMVKTWSPLYVVGRKLGFLAAVTTDAMSGMEREGVSLFSMVFGNAVGLVETRRGKLYKKGDVLADIGASLKAGDILLEKTPFRLTDKLIPGYWGHAAVWIGTEAELTELGIWNDPLVARHHDEIRQGRLVVEALRSGVEMNTLQHFLNIDSLGILRKPNQSREARATTIMLALRQVGKPYDFNFDVESKERVYCSKLVYLSYSDIDWPTRRSLGRTTFTPDDVAAKVAKDDALQLVTFYHDGERVSDAPIVRMVELMGIGRGR